MEQTNNLEQIRSRRDVISKNIAQRRKELKTLRGAKRKEKLLELRILVDERASYNKLILKLSLRAKPAKAVGRIFADDGKMYLTKECKTVHEAHVERNKIARDLIRKRKLSFYSPYAPTKL